jgi:Tol biopolymer transport system component
MRRHRTNVFGAAVASGVVALVFASVSAASATPTTGGGSLLSRSTASTVSGKAAGDRNGGWIAFATHERGVGDTSNPQYRSGSDVFVTSIGRRPKLVAGRGSHDAIWNECPTFSPNGRMLAFARVTGTQSWKAGTVRSTIVVVRIATRGPMRAGRLVLKVPHGALACPRWSGNSSRLAYLDRGKVVILGLDGSGRHRAKGDPTIRDFRTSGNKIVSPTGELIARLGDSSIIISRPDGTTRNTIPDNLEGYPSYAIAGWSPDGRKLLLMKDVGGGFQMRAVSVDSPFASETVVSYVRVNGERSWPGYGDVSWQPDPS